MAYYVISSENLMVTINDQGAEIVKIHGTTKSIDYLWNGDPSVWPKTSPVLFPVIGGLKENTYTYDGKKYNMNRHGFCRESVFTVTEQTKSVITFTLEANEYTLSQYPFAFRFSVKHEIKDNQLFVSYIVENLDTKPMLFSVGAHPGFYVPIHSTSSFEDYYLLFSSVENTGRYLINKEGLIENTPTPLLQNTDRLLLTRELLNNDALVFKTLKSTSISLLSNTSEYGFKYTFHGFPYMGIWQPKDAPFLCIEPWCGLGDTVGSSYAMEEKEGMNELPVGETFVRSWDVEFF